MARVLQGLNGLSDLFALRCKEVQRLTKLLTDDESLSFCQNFDIL